MWYSRKRSLPLTVTYLCWLLSVGNAAKFATTGPVLTVTLKDPVVGVDKTQDATKNGKWGIDMSALRPSLLWSLRSLSAPLPYWFPALKSCRATVGYQYENLHKLPSFVEGDATLSNEMGEIHVQPTYEVKRRKASVVVQAIRGESYFLAKFTTKGKRILEFLRGSYQTNLPFSSVSAVRVTPSFDFVQSTPSCTIESITGSGRTKAVLNLQMNNPTLTVLHTLDQRNTIAPEISLQTAKILYQWNVALDSGSIRTKVDPTSDIHVTWTDRSMNGKWVTDFRLPLAGTTVSALAADIRVRRQFSF